MNYGTKLEMNIAGLVYTPFDVRRVQIEQNIFPDRNLTDAACMAILQRLADEHENEGITWKSIEDFTWEYLELFWGTDQVASDDEDEEVEYLNFYKCPEPACKEEWESTWSCACNDQCPKCGMKDIEPYESQILESEKTK